MEWLKSFINKFFDYLYDGFQWLLEGGVHLLKYIAFTVYDGILTVISSFSAAIDLSAVAFNMAAQYSHMPTQLIWLINQVNLPQSMTYVVGAIVIRMLLNIIPAALTRI